MSECLIYPLQGIFSLVCSPTIHLRSTLSFLLSKLCTMDIQARNGWCPLLLLHTHSQDCQTSFWTYCHSNLSDPTAFSHIPYQQYIFHVHIYIYIVSFTNGISSLFLSRVIALSQDNCQSLCCITVMIFFTVCTLTDCISLLALLTFGSSSALPQF